jgi:hypothetical protein
MSTIEVNKITPVSGGTAIQVGESGDTITVPSGATITNSGTATNFTSYRPNVDPLFINGDMAVAQRGTTKTSASGYTTVDRIRNFLDDGVVTASQSTDVPSGYSFSKSYKLDVTTADSSVANNHLAAIQYKFEGQDLQVFKKGTANAEKYTLAFWVKSTKTGTFICELEDDDNSRACSQAYTVSTTNTWEYKVLNFPADTTGAFAADNGESLKIHWWLMAGTDYTSGTLATTWASTTAANRCVGQVNALDSTSNDFLLTGVQLEVGEYTSATIPPFQHESYGNNLARCQRYYYKLGPLTQDEYFGSGNIDGSNDAQIFIPFPTKMRTGPSAIETDGTASHYVIRVTSDVACDAVPVFSNTSELNAMTTFKKSSHGKTNEAGAFGRSNNDDAYLAWSAEL